jgi:electron transfer flavoprotein alpha subunit
MTQACKDIWVFAETKDGGLSEVSLELLGAAKALAGQKGGGMKVAALILGEDTAQAAEEAFCYGAEIAYTIDSPLLKTYSTDAYTKAVCQAAEAYQPEIFLLGGTLLGRDLAPRVAARLHTGLTADSTHLEMQDGILVMTKPAYSENMMSKTVCETARPQMATVRPGVVTRNPYVANASGERIAIEPALSPGDIRTEVVGTHQEEQKVPLADADIVIVGGRAVGGKKGFRMLQELADKVGGAVGATRVTINAGWAGQSIQIGQTGINVAPRLLIVCGASGALQFTAGILNADTIVAINKDPNAPIFEVADFGIVGDIFDVVPSLIRQWDDAEELFYASKQKH